jgi:alpha-tubulin suppressor-like RCC1 family protein
VPSASVGLSIAEPTLVNPSEQEFRQVSAGGDHTCAVKRDGTLCCWGSTQFGQVGNGQLTPGAAPFSEVTGVGGPVAQVSAGKFHTCVVTAVGSVMCWGNGSSGRLGTGNQDSTASPSIVADAGESFRQVSAGGAHTCALTVSQRIYCWGVGTDGQVGDGEIAASLVPAREYTLAADWALVSAGDDHSCGQKADGRWFCWGDGQYGQIGNDSTLARSIPTQVGAWMQMSAAFDHTCAVRGNGKLYCWGAGALARLGNGIDTANRATPTLVAGGFEDWTRVSAGAEHSCAIRSDGSLYCWGNQADGRVGNGFTTNTISSPSLVQQLSQPSIVVWNSISAGSRHTCGAANVGATLVAYCWGNNLYGRLGNGNESDTPHSSPVVVQEPLSSPAEISVGAEHSCARTKSDTLYCWGHGNSGRLGLGNSFPVVQPIPALIEDTTWQQVSVGEAHTCAVANDQRAFCWGLGLHGRLGNNGTQNAFSPSEVAGNVTNWRTVSAGARHTCAIRDDGSLSCFGQNSEGRLGIGAADDQIVPVEVAGGRLSWWQVSAGGRHTCAVKTDGRAYCWGRADVGQLGHGATTPDAWSPIAVVEPSL